MSDLVTQRITQPLLQLRLQTAAATLDNHVRVAAERDFSPLQFVDHVLADELAARQERSITVRTKLAHFPVLKTVDSFEFDAQPSVDRKVVKQLETLAFVGRPENVVLLGPPGVGKTHLSIGLGVRALQGGHGVYFLTAQDLLDQIRIAQLDGIPASASATSIARRLLRATRRSRTGEAFSLTRSLPARWSTGCCTIVTSSTSRATATAFDPRCNGPPPLCVNLAAKWVRLNAAALGPA